MYSANRFPVLIYDRDAREAYKSGGLAAKARDVADAGRYEDTHIIHVTDDELDMLRQQWGEPSINPHTGMPEFGLFGKIFKVFKKIAPIAAFAVPFVGPALGTALGVSAPIASAGLGAGLGAIGGGGLKGALLGGALGGLGAGGAQGVGAKVGTGILGQAANPRLAQAFGSALLGGAASAALGGNPLMGALSVGLGNYLRNPMAAGTAGPVPASVDLAASGPSTLSATPTEIPAVSVKNPIPNFGGSTASTAIPANSISQSALRAAASAPPVVNNAFQITSPGLQETINKIAASGPGAGTAATTAAAPVAKSGFWNKNFLGIKGVPNKIGIPAALALAAAADAAKPKSKETDSEAARQQFFGSGFSQSGLNAPGNFKLASVAKGLSSGSDPMEDYSKQYFNYAAGGDVGGEGRSNRGSFAVHGPGDGRSDEIPAMLSDGEYVIDAETVALLGNGSPKAGAKRLDDLRVKIRKHKGKKLAKGKFSPNAKPAEKYMAGGRI